jgi:CubicO group peptidase (beta-lactamase class C family)
MVQLTVNHDQYSIDQIHRWQRGEEGELYGLGGPGTHYLYLHTLEFYRNSWIYRDGPVSELPSRPDPAVAALPTVSQLGALPLVEYALHPESRIDSLIVVRGGEIVYEAYPRMEPNERHLYHSVSKPFAALVMAILEEQELLDTHMPVETYLPEVRGSGWEGVPLLDVLDMASGIDCLEIASEFEDPESAHNKWQAADDVAGYVAKIPRLRPSGEAFQYTSVNTFLLAWTLERVTGRPYNELVSRHVWSKLGAETDAVVSWDHDGPATGAHWGLSTRLRDLARFGLLYTPSWRKVAVEPVVPPSHLEQIQSGGRPPIFQAQDDLAWLDAFGADKPVHNSQQWDLVWPDGDFYKGGYGGQGLYVSPSRDLVIGFFGAPTPDWPINELKAVSRQVAKQL